MPKSKSKSMSRRAAAIVRRFHEAAVAMSWKGGTDPEDWEEVESEYKRARDELRDYIAALENQEKL